MIVDTPIEVTISFLPEPRTSGSIRVHVTRLGTTIDRESPAELVRTQHTASQLAESYTEVPKTWIFQASPTFSDVKGALRSIEEPVCLVRQFRKGIEPGDKVYLWECGPAGGIVGVAEVCEAPRIQAEPPEQLPFIREKEKFAGDRLRVKLRVLKRIAPVISRKYLLSRPELTGLTILRCPRGTNFRVSCEQAAVLQRIVEQVASFGPSGNGSGEKRIVFAEG